MRLEGAANAWRNVHLPGVEGTAACITCVKLMYCHSSLQRFLVFLSGAAVAVTNEAQEPPGFVSPAAASRDVGD